MTPRSTRRARRRPRLPPPWIRRATWVRNPETGNPEFLFPGLSPEAEDNALALLDNWAENDANARALGEWMVLVEPYQTPSACHCPACVAEREGRA
jgi:hypothetical protein